MLKKKKIEEALTVGGGATGVSKTADPIVKGSVHANRPQDKKGAEPIDTTGMGQDETPSDSNVKPTKGNADTTGSIKAKPSTASAANVKEDKVATFDASELFEAFGVEDITEEFKTKVETIFTAAVASKVEEAVAVIEADLVAVNEEKAVADLATLNESIDKYLSYAAAEFVKINELAIEKSLRTEITENFMEGLKKVFEENYMTIPEEKMDLVGEMTAEIERLDAALNEKIEENIALSKVVTESVKAEILDAASEGLATTQQAKMKSLSESIEFTDADDFKKKVTVIKENFFRTPPAKPSNLLMEDAEGEIVEETQYTGNMAKYVAAISRTSKA